MNRHPYRWGLAAVTVVAVLVAGLLMAPWASSEAVAKEPRATLGKIMIPAAAFVSNSDDTDYFNYGYYLTPDTGYGSFLAPLSFPVPEVSIRKIILIAFDNSDGDSKQVCLTLYRAEPLRPDESEAGNVCTVDSSDMPQKVVTTAISPRRINTVNHGPYLWAIIDSGAVLYGVQVVYSY